MMGMPGAGRYAPSPSGDLHYGNLRTALLAWLWARSTGRDFRMRVDDIDTQRSSAASAERQLADLAALGIDWDGDVLYQHDRFDAYANTLRHLEQRGLVYECYCSRREIQEAARAPHAVPGSYPGTCRSLDDATRAQRRANLAAAGRVPALRLRADVTQWTVHDFFAGDSTGDVDDMVLPWWSTMHFRALTRWFVAGTCFPPRPGRRISRAFWVLRLRIMCMCRWCSAPRDAGWPNVTVLSRSVKCFTTPRQGRLSPGLLRLWVLDR